MLRLPKNVASHALAPKLEARFTQSAAPMRDGSTLVVSHWAFDAALRELLKVAFAAQHLVQGLELIDRMLAREQKGLAATSPNPRLSRLVFLANDGSDRFYRDAERLLAQHAERVWGVLVAATGEELGRAFTTKGQIARALMIDDRVTLEQALLAFGSFG
jgi:hypothetical protein